MYTDGVSYLPDHLHRGPPHCINDSLLRYFSSVRLRPRPIRFWTSITLFIFGENSNPWRKLFLQVAPGNAHSLSEQTLNHTSHNIEKTLIRNPCEQLAIHSRVLQYIFIYKIYLILLQTKHMKIYKIYLLLLSKQNRWKYTKYIYSYWKPNGWKYTKYIYSY